MGHPVSAIDVAIFRVDKLPDYLSFRSDLEDASILTLRNRVFPLGSR